MSAPVAQTSTRHAPRVTRRAGVDHRSPLGQRRLDGQSVRALRDGQRLAGQRRLVDLEPLLLDDAPVGGDAFALADEQDVARHDLLGRDLGDDSVADDDRPLRERLGQREDRALGRDLLPEAQGAVHDEDGGDRHSLDDVADRDRDGGRGDEQEHERVERTR